MALKLSIPRQTNGFRAEFPQGYHRIGDVQINAMDGNVRVLVLGYADETARKFDQHPQPVTQENHFVSVADFESVPLDSASKATVKELVTAKSYLALKKFVEKFAKAEDC